jgi:hypothetical protein
MSAEIEAAVGAFERVFSSAGPDAHLTHTVGVLDKEDEEYFAMVYAPGP